MDSENQKTKLIIFFGKPIPIYSLSADNELAYWLSIFLQLVVDYQLDNSTLQYTLSPPLLVKKSTETGLLFIVD